MAKKTDSKDSRDGSATSAKVTVFSDGSTFDYENGYRSNGAAVPTRERPESPSIVKSHQIFTNAFVLKLVILALILASVILGLIAGISNMQRDENLNVIKAAISKSGEVFQTAADRIILKDSRGETLDCTVSMLSNNGDPVAHVFCDEGQPATFSTQLRRDPANILHMAPFGRD